MSSLSCGACGYHVFLEAQKCTNCGRALAFHWPSLGFVVLPEEGEATVEIDGRTWSPCARWDWQCNWLAGDDDNNPRCLSCRLTRRRPESDDTLALELLAEASVAKRRLVVQLLELGLPITAYYEREGGLAFDMISSRSGNEKVIIGHANGVITIDLAETLDAHREALRVSLGEPYRTMLGHLRHEVGHYYQGVLVDTDERWEECRRLFGDERASYQEAIARHYADGAPTGWVASYISEYATMHPWEDFAETFAHYLHITGTLATAARTGVTLQADRVQTNVTTDVVPRTSYADTDMATILWDWYWLSQMFNRVNQSMGQRDLYPFAITTPVVEKLAFLHELVTAAR
jgi:hypothetical protein